MLQAAHSAPKRHDQRVILHFDYDCFYAAVFEKEDPSLKSLPFAVQQKQIIVTCNYEARKRGLYKLQLVREAKNKVPDVIIALGENLDRFRNASKDNYDFLRSYTWSNKVERLGFDEVFMDVTDLISYNVELLNHHQLTNSFFHLDRSDPTIGFFYDASTFSGHVYPRVEGEDLASRSAAPDDPDDLMLRLRVSSHLAQHLRHELDNQKGYTSTVGISTNKLLSKLVGNVNKPRGQTTLIPPYNANLFGESNARDFIDAHDVGKIPGIGFKTAQKIRAYILGRPAAFDPGLVYGGSYENIHVKDVRLFSGVGPKLLQKILEAPGVPKDLPEKIWGLLNGVDDTEVGKAREVPQQISIEDSYIRLDEMPAVLEELKLLTVSLIKRMRLDLTTSIDDEDELNAAFDQDGTTSPILPRVAPTKRWLAYPKTLRLSTRPRPPLNLDGTRQRTFARISKSGPLPSYAFNLTAGVDDLARRLVDETIMPLFRKLHPESSGWNLSLVNICATNMTMGASNGKDGAGRDIARMFQKQEGLLKEWRVMDDDSVGQQEQEAEMDGAAAAIPVAGASLAQDSDDRLSLDHNGSEDHLMSSQDSVYDDIDDDLSICGETCTVCGAIMPAFAQIAHARFHNLPD